MSKLWGLFVVLLIFVFFGIGWVYVSRSEKSSLGGNNLNINPTPIVTKGYGYVIKDPKEEPSKDDGYVLFRPSGFFENVEIAGVDMSIVRGNIVGSDRQVNIVVQSRLGNAGRQISSLIDLISKTNVEGVSIKEWYEIEDLRKIFRQDITYAANFFVTTKRIQELERENPNNEYAKIFRIFEQRKFIDLIKLTSYLDGEFRELINIFPYTYFKYE